MQLLHLEYFKLLAENEHLLKTAKLIHISPPALSTTINKLEKELGVELFDRTGRTIKLNENGKILYIHVCNIFSELDSIDQAFTKTADKRQDIITVGVNQMSLWNEVISAFMLTHPNITVQHIHVRMEDFKNSELLSTYDMVLAESNDITFKSWNHEFIVEDPPAIIVNKSHKFANRDTISLFEARDEGFITLSKGFSNREYFDHACKQSGFIPHIVAETDVMLRTKLIEAGYGIGFNSLLGAHSFKTPNLHIIRVNYPPSPRIQTVFWRSGIAQTNAAIEFRNFVVNYYSNHNL